MQQEGGTALKAILSDPRFTGAGPGKFWTLRQKRPGSTAVVGITTLLFYGKYLAKGMFSKRVSPLSDAFARGKLFLYRYFQRYYEQYYCCTAVALFEMPCLTRHTSCYGETGSWARNIYRVKRNGCAPSPYLSVFRVIRQKLEKEKRSTKLAPAQKQAQKQVVSSFLPLPRTSAYE